MSDGFICSTCGKTHHGLPTDQAYKLPDIVWEIPEEERSERAKFTADLCFFEGGHFIRCFLPIPFTEAEGCFGWGVWVEVDQPVFKRYLAMYEADGSSEPQYHGRVANALPAYEDTLGTRVQIQFGARDKRPTAYLLDDDHSPLAVEQRYGIDGRRYHEILAACH